MKKYFHLSNDGYNFIKQIEECRNKPYLSNNGLYTVGLNHNGEDVDPNKMYSDEEIKMLFEEDKNTIEDDVNKIFDSRFMTQNMFDACFSFAYNVGNISNTDLGKMIAKNPFDDDLEKFWLYTYTNGQKNKSLVERRKKEIELYFKDYK